MIKESFGVVFPKEPEKGGINRAVLLNPLLMMTPALPGSPVCNKALHVLKDPCLPAIDKNAVIVEDDVKVIADVLPPTPPVALLLPRTAMLH